MTDGLIRLRSQHDAAKTAARIVEELPVHDLVLIARVDHAGAARKAGLSLDPTELLIFGNPRGGTPLMQVARTIAIDLPLRMLVWTDEKGTWVGYDDPEWLANRHGIPTDNPAVTRVAWLLAAIAAHVTS